MRVGALATLAILALIALPLTAAAGPAQDTDGDGTFDALDNCINVANAAPQDCDTDQDGYGNSCDGDYNNDGIVSPVDFSPTFLADFTAGSDSGVGTDMNCDGLVTPVDFSPFFLGQFAAGAPGPSGLSCAGTVPCP
jgi:hypothetical protein